MVFSLTWLADTLRAVNLPVVEVAGWTNRGVGGDVTSAKGVVCHHTAGPLTGNTPSLNLVINGRSDLSGPLSQLFLARDGTYHVVAAGRAHHAGPGKWQDVTNGNAHFIGIEAENTGALPLFFVKSEPARQCAVGIANMPCQRAARLIQASTWSNFV
jgi:hypothetical protein